MSHTSYLVTVDGRNVSDITSTHKLTADLQLFGLPPAGVQDELGKRQPNIDGVLEQNIVQRLEWNTVMRRFQIHSGEWDMADYDHARRVLRCLHLWIVAVRESGRTQVTMDETTGLRTPYWASILPVKVIAEFGEPSYDFKDDRWMQWAIKFRSERPIIGTIIP